MPVDRRREIFVAEKVFNPLTQHLGAAAEGAGDQLVDGGTREREQQIQEGQSDCHIEYWPSRHPALRRQMTNPAIICSVCERTPPRYTQMVGDTTGILCLLASGRAFH